MKKKINSMLFFVALFGCEEAVPLYQIEGQQCGLLSNGNVITGEDAELISCNLGKTENVLVDGKTKQICVGFRPISEEVCDIKNIDEDCDGEANNIVLSYGHPNNDCSDEAQGVCIYSTKECVNNTMTCVPPEHLYGEEVCDPYERDENCNGFSNENDPTLVLQNEEWSYPGPDGTLNVGECRAGHNECYGGYETYFGLKTPTDEICGNGDDDDCNGIVDDADLVETDYLLSIDNSGSMGMVRSSVLDTICGWSQQDVHLLNRFAIVLFGAGYDLPHHMIKITDFVSSDEACDALGSFLLDYPGSSGGNEYQMDSVLYTFDDILFLNLDWDDTRKKKVVVFTDEPIQTELGNGNDQTTDKTIVTDLLVNDCRQRDYTVSAFIEYYANDYNLWMTTTVTCGGFIEQISIIPQIMISRLNYWFGNCE